MKRRALFLVVAAFLAGWAARGDEVIPVPQRGEAQSSRNVTALGKCDLEQVRLANGRVYQGLIKSEADDGIEFLEVLQPQGNRTYAVGLHIPRNHIVTIDRLAPPSRKRLEHLVDDLRNRGAVETAQMRALPIISVQNEGRTVAHYRSEWFRLESTADDETTRRSIVRIEQVFGFYRLLLPPTVLPAQTPRILLFGSAAEYREYVLRQGWKIDNPAFFSPRDNLVVAGSELSRFAAELQKIRGRHEELANKYARLKVDLPARLRDESLRLKRQGAQGDELQKLNVMCRQRLDAEIVEVDREIARCDRENVAMFDEVTRQMFATLYHEAFHAYLENYVYPRPANDVPRWLNEGLAQIFEGGLLESGQLRVDAPREDSLAQLQADLRTNHPLNLKDLLTSSHQAFLATDPPSRDASKRHYVYAWGLAYYLALEKHLLGTKALDDYVAVTDTSASAQERFERLVGMSLSEFEGQWRKYMLALKGKGRPG